jgi:hypothetical protein
MVRLKLFGAPPHPLQLMRTNQERFVADWEAIGEARTLLEVAFVWPPGAQTSVRLKLIEGPAKVLLATGRKFRLLARSPSTSGRQR